MNLWLSKIIFWNIRRWQLLVVFVFFIIFGIFYWFVLYLTIYGNPNLWGQTLVNFVTKGLALLPFYWLVFVRLRQFTPPSRLFLHILLCPLYIGAWLLLYHAVCKLFHIEYLTGSGTWWDILYCVQFYAFLFSIFHAYEYYKKNKMEVEVNHELKEAKLQNELAALKAQINPHFLYNVFNTINASIPPANEHAREIISKLADLFRYQLKGSLNEYVTLKDELDFIEKYLSLEKERFGDKLSYTIICDEKYLDYWIPSLILQPLVENALVHGIAPKMEEGTVDIIITKNKQELEIIIKDNGPGFKVPANEILASGVGLSNTNKRLLLLYGKGLSIERNSREETLVGLSLKIKI